jgi:signal transduction histidine kinase
VGQDALDHFQSSQKQLSEQVADLRARNRELEAYAHMIAHDIKDPLHIMGAIADLISHTPNLARQDLEEYMQQIRSTGTEMSRTIDNLLLFAEVLDAEAPRGVVHMDQVVANVLARLNHFICEQQAQLSLPEVWPDAVGYGPWIEDVWANYLSNAIKYGGQPPRVELGASVLPDGNVRFWMRDHGPGIPLEVQTLLFTPFSQIGRLPNQGQGLGLSIVLHIIKKMGGKVAVESEVGQGSLFSFTLPAAASLESDPGVDKPSPTDACGRGWFVL